MPKVQEEMFDDEILLESLRQKDRAAYFCAYKSVFFKAAVSAALFYFL